MPSADCSLNESPARQVLKVRGLRKAFGGHVVLADAAADACAGDVVLICGDNGSGKTTLLNILTGNLRPDAGMIEINVDGHSKRFAFPRSALGWRPDTRSFVPERLALDGVGRTWQNMRLFRTQSVLENVAVSALEQAGENPLCVLFAPWKVRRDERILGQQCRDRLRQVGLKEALSGATAGTLSLGEAKRLEIARAISAGVKLLFLDEPLAALDREGRRALVDLLAETVRRQQITTFIVEHPSNISNLDSLATRIWRIEDHAIDQQESGARGGSLAVEAVVLDRDAILQGLYNTPFEEVQLARDARLTIARNPGKTTARPLLEIRDVCVARRGHPVVHMPPRDVHDMNRVLRLWAGDVAILEAPNGWGKTTLLEAIAGLIPIESGSISVCGRDITHLPSWTRSAAGLSFLRSASNVFVSLAVRESLALARITDHPSDVQPLLHRNVGDLSGGEQRRVALTEALMRRDGKVLLLDEPFAGLDAVGLVDWMARLKRAMVDRAVLIAGPST